MSSTESKYLTTMDNLDSYRGKWIAIVGNNIVAEGKTISKVYRDAQKVSGGKTPLFHRVPENDEEQFLFLYFFFKVLNIDYFIIFYVDDHRYVDKMNFKYCKMSRVDSTTDETKIVQLPQIKVVFKPHMSLNWNILEKSAQAFVRKMPPKEETVIDEQTGEEYNVK